MGHWECSRKQISEVLHHLPHGGTAQRTPLGQQGERNGRNNIVLGMCSSPPPRNLTSTFTQIWELSCSRQSQVQKAPFRVAQTVAIPPPVAAIWAGLKLSRGYHPLVRGRRRRQATVWKPRCQSRRSVACILSENQITICTLRTGA